MKYLVGISISLPNEWMNEFRIWDGCSSKSWGGVSSSNLNIPFEFSNEWTNVGLDMGPSPWVDTVYLVEICYSIIMNECLDTPWEIILSSERIFNEMDAHPWVEARHLVEVSWGGYPSMIWGGVSCKNFLIP